MIDAGLQGRLTALLQTAGGPVLELGDAAVAPAGLRAGDTVVARAVSTLPEGKLLVELAGTRVAMRLPEGSGIAPGQAFRLAVLETAPALKLQLAAAAPPAPQPPGTMTVSLSPLAERLAAVLDAGGGTAGSTSAKTPLPVAPVLPAPETRGERLAAPLRQALETSGLFYESHQAQWLAGARDEQTLRAEPQGRAEPAPATAASAPAEGRQQLPPAVVTVLERQVDALSSGQLSWTGELWPGQWLEWQVDERGAAHGGGYEAAPWRTRLRLELPGLGVVEARIELAGAALRVSVATGHAGASGAMRSAEQDLRAALEARGLDLRSLLVEAAGGG